MTRSCMLTSPRLQILQKNDIICIFHVPWLTATGYSDDLDTFLDKLHKLQVLDLHLSVLEPYDLHLLHTSMNRSYCLRIYFANFRSDPERSKEFNYERLRPVRYIYRDPLHEIFKDAV